MKRSVLALSAISMASIALTGCFSSSNNSLNSTIDDEPTASVRVVHGISDAPNVDIYVDGVAVEALQNVPFGAASPFLDLPVGERSIAVVPAGGELEDALDVSGLDGPVILNEGDAFTIAATNTLENPWVRLYADDTASPTNGAEIRVIHLSPDSPADVDVFLSGNDDDLASGTDPTANVVYDGINEGEFTDFVPVDAGTYRVRVTGAGADPSEPENVAFDFRDITLNEGDRRTIIAIDGSRAITPLDLLVLTDLADPAFVNWQDDRVGLRVIHAVQGGPDVDVLVDGAELASEVPYRTVSEYFVLPLSGAASADVRVEVPQIAFDENVTVDRATDYTAIAVDTSSAAPTLALLEDDLSQLPATQARVRAFHAATSSGGIDSVDIFLNGARAIEGLAEGTVTDFDGDNYTLLPRGSYEIDVVAETMERETAAISGMVDLEGRGIYTLLAIGREAEDDSLELLEAIDSTDRATRTD